jgi:hypothetical protein
MEILTDLRATRENCGNSWGSSNIMIARPKSCDTASYAIKWVQFPPIIFSLWHYIVITHAHIAPAIELR